MNFFHALHVLIIIFPLLISKAEALEGKNHYPKLLENSGEWSITPAPIQKNKGRKYDALVFEKGVEKIDLETLESGELGLLGQELFKISLFPKTRLTLHLNNPQHPIELKIGEILVENNNPWGKYNLTTPIGDLIIYRETKFHLSLSSQESKGKDFYLWVEKGVVELPGGEHPLVTEGFSAQKQKNETVFEIQKASHMPNTNTNTRESSPVRKGIQGEVGILGSTSSYETFLYEIQNISRDQGFFYQAKLGILGNVTTLPINVRVDLAVKNQFDQQNSIKKNMAYQYAEGELRYDTDFYIFSRWISMEIPIVYHLQWRSLNGDPTQQYLKTFKVAPRWKGYIANGHSLSFSPFFQRATQESDFSGHIYGVLTEYSLRARDNFLFPLRLSMMKKENWIGKLQFGIVYGDYSFLGEVFDYTRNQKGRGYKLYAEYTWQNIFDLGIAARFSSVFTNQQNSPRGFKDFSQLITLSF